MKSWTNDIDGLCVALRHTKSRREAIKLIVDWRAPSPPPPPAPEPAFEDEPRQDPPVLTREEYVAHGKALQAALVKGPPGTSRPLIPRRPR